MYTTTLTPLSCLSCDEPIPAQPDEVAWVCAVCGAACRLTKDHELVEVSVHFSDGIESGTKGEPYWVVQVWVNIEERVSDSGKAPLNDVWEEERLVFLPAFQTSLNDMIEITTTFYADPPSLSSGSRCDFKPVVLRPQGLSPLIEFLVLNREATRGDKLQKLNFEINLGTAELWVLPQEMNPTWIAPLPKYGSGKLPWE